VKVVTLQRPSLAPPIVAWAATGAVLTAAVVTGVVALGASSDLKSDLAAFPGNPSQISSAYGKTHALAVTTDVLSAVTAAGIGVSIWLTVRAQRAPSVVEPPPVPATARVVVSPSGLGLAGSF
jgi:hypothetical protein